MKNKIYIFKNIKKCYNDSGGENMDIQTKFKQMLQSDRFKSYSFIILNCHEDLREVIESLEELFHDVIKIDLGNDDVFLAYPNTLDIECKELKDMFLSLSVDLGTKIKVFKGGCFSVDNLNEVSVIYKGYLKFKNRNFSFATISDLIMYLIYGYVEVLKELKEIIMMKFRKDAQLFKLVNEMFNNDLNISKTANSMFMHRNTINNKIEVIRKETGFNVQCFNDAIALYVILKLV